MREWRERQDDWHKVQVQDAIQRLQSDKDRAMRELRERQDDWRKVTAGLGIVVQWDDAAEVDNDGTTAD